MVFGIGVDMVENRRLAAWVIKPALLSKYFTNQELLDVQESSHPQSSLAARFAAKEAFAKAVGTGFRGISLREIGTVRDPLGRPRLELTGSARKLVQDRGITAIHLSLTHEKEYSMAFVVLEA